MTVERRDDDAATAAGWYARLRAGDADEADRAGFRAWHDGDPAHARSWAAIGRVDAGLDGLRRHGRGDDRLAAMIAAAKADAAPARHRSMPASGWAMAAALLLTLGIGGGLLTGHAAAPPMRQAIAVSGTGQIRQLRLPDGSTMTLDAQSVAVVEAPGAQRRVRIDRGRALFAVAKDAAHPFVVSASDAVVTALGTHFSVEREAERLTVALVEGSVRIDLPGGRSRTLAAGDVLTLADGRVAVQAGAAAIDTEWRTGTLTFDSLPLATVAARLNHYSPQRIVIADATLARRPFSGVLATGGGGDALAAALSAYGIARVSERTPDHITLAPL